MPEAKHQECVPDIGRSEAVEIIEIHVKTGDALAPEQAMVTLETDKATMELPASTSGTVAEVLVAVGDKVKQGDPLLWVSLDQEELQVEPQAVDAKTPEPEPALKQPIPKEAATPAARTEDAAEALLAPFRDHPVGKQAGVYAGPATRQLATSLGLDLKQVPGTGPQGRVLPEDVHVFVKKGLTQGGTGQSACSMPFVDFSQWGPITEQPLSRIRRKSGQHLQQCWLSIPHVTQFDQADITDLEAYRQEHKGLFESQGFKFTPLLLVMKAVAGVLRDFPDMNGSLSPNGDTVIHKGYCHLGIAVDTPEGLVVPVVRDVRMKSIIQLAKELAELSQAARLGRLSGQDMQGSTFTLSSLGGVGGTAFTPIVNAPNVGILGLSKAQIQPRWDGGQFVPRLMLPLSLSYDHRVIDGAQAARFTTALVRSLENVQHLILS